MALSLYLAPEGTVAGALLVFKLVQAASSRGYLLPSRPGSASFSFCTPPQELVTIVYLEAAKAQRAQSQFRVLHRQAAGYTRGAPADQGAVDAAAARAAPPAAQVPRLQEDRPPPVPRALPQGAPSAPASLYPCHPLPLTPAQGLMLNPSLWQHLPLLPCKFAESQVLLVDQ